MTRESAELRDLEKGPHGYAHLREDGPFFDGCVKTALAVANGRSGWSASGDLLVMVAPDGSAEVYRLERTMTPEEVTARAARAR